MSDRPLAGVPYALLCVIHDAAALAAGCPELAEFSKYLAIELGQDDFAGQLEALQVAIRSEVRARGIPPRYASSWDALGGGETRVQ